MLQLKLIAIFPKLGLKMVLLISVLQASRTVINFMLCIEAFLRNIKKESVFNLYILLVIKCNAFKSQDECVLD